MEPEENKPSQFCALMDAYDKARFAGLFVAERPLLQTEWWQFMATADEMFAFCDLLEEGRAAGGPDEMEAYAVYPSIDALLILAAKRAGVAVMVVDCAEVSYSE